MQIIGELKVVTRSTRPFQDGCFLFFQKAGIKMRKRRRRHIIISTVIGLLIIVAGYFSFFWTPKSSSQTKVSVGIVGANKGDIAIWKSVAKTVKEKYGIILTTKSFDGYDQPDKALKSGDVDLNAFGSFHTISLVSMIFYYLCIAKSLIIRIDMIATNDIS